MKVGEVGQFFSLSLVSGILELSDKTRESYVAEIDRQQSEDPHDETWSKYSSWTGVVMNNYAIHNNPIFSELFLSVKDIIKSYCNKIGVNYDKFDFYTARSWGTITKENQSIEGHDHSYCNLSIIYYPKVSEDAGLLFMQPPAPYQHPNEFISNLFNVRDKDILDPYNYNCSKQISIKPSSDMFIIFPAKVSHRTQNQTSSKPRYSIAIDIVATLKESNNTEYALPPLTQWSKI